MRVNNVLVEKSFQYSQEKPDMFVRSDEIGNLAEVIDYCGEIHEKLFFDECIWSMEVEAGILFSEWLYACSGEGRADDRRRLQEFITKNCKEKNNSAFSDKAILVSLGQYPQAVSCEKEYVRARRDILAGIGTAEEYNAFMRSCFIKSIFGDNILAGLKQIKDFSERTREITDNLAVLNDEAVGLYLKYHDNLKKAIDILDKKMLACSLDPAHKKELEFSFTYSEEGKEGDVKKVKKISCSPHLKLLREDSDLRIYFWWQDEKIGDNKKVLVGWIGRHPY